MKGIYKKISALILSAFLLVGLLPVGGLFTFATDSVIEIRTVEDLISLANSCRNDSWSYGKTVKLMADLDLKGSSFTCIPVFAGSFDGNNHKITGFELDDLGDASGFFRYLYQGAEVKNLTIEGVVNTENDGECVGGIVGINRGTIAGCTFSGSVSGNQSVAAIAGVNAPTGIIRNCISQGTVDAPYEVGGIVGTNHGVVRNCTNKAVINNDRAFIDEMDESGFSWIISSISLDENIRITAGTDVGGIAGYSDGSILSCTNQATVGYEHTGYNVGGIVGRQAGVVSLCTNEGTVLGRKDVGGIAGQMEPFVSVDEAESISEAVKDLHDLVDRLLTDLSDTSSTISDDVNKILEHTDTALELGNDISKEFIDFTNSNIDAMNLLADEVAYVMENLPAILDSLDLSAEAARSFAEDLKRINDDLDILDKLDKNAYSETRHGRLTLTSAVGGYVSTDNQDPEKGISVKLTVHEQEGYRLSKIVIYDAEGRSVKFTEDGDGCYSFVMPEENVVVRTVYTFVGNFYLVTNAGGLLSKAYSAEAEKLRLTVKPNSGYSFEKVTVGDQDYAIADFNFDSIQNVYTLEVDRKLPEKVTYISTEFYKEETSHLVKLSSTTGGTVTADKLLCPKDEVVELKVAEASDYILSSLTLISNGEKTDLIASRSAEEALESPNEYSFVMPDADARVEAVFRYSDSAKDNEETIIYTESSIGGTVYYVKNPTSNDYIVYMVPEAGYEVSEEAAITIFSAAVTGKEEANPVGSLSTEQLTQYGAGYSYTLNYTQIEAPIRVYGAFTEIDSSRNLVVTTGTGGLASVDKIAAKEGDTIKLAVLTSEGYRIRKISIISEGKEVSYALKEDMTNVYEFTMPDGDVDIVVEFSPIVFIVNSNSGGTVSVTANGDVLKFTVKPDDGYNIGQTPVVFNADGEPITLIKRNAGVYAYELDLNGIKEPIFASVSFYGATDYEVVENSRDTIDEQSKKLTSSINSVQKTVDEITDLVTNDYGEIIDAEEFVKDSDKVNELIKLLIRLSGEVAEAGEAASYLISSINTMTNVLGPYVIDAVKALNEDADQAVEDLDESLMYLQQAGNQIKAVVEYLNAQPSVKFTELSKDFSDNMSSLFDEMKEISSQMGQLNSDFSSYSDIVIEDLRAINDKTNDILELIIDMVNNVENAYKGDDFLFEDVSDEELETVTDGKVSGCINKGTVRADLNVGGIVGAMSVDTEDPEDNAAGSVDWNFRNTYVTKCVLTDCVNKGSVVAKSDGVGAVAGYQGIGVINACNAYGTVKSNEGGYVGGVAGHSKAIVRNCNSLCSLSGSNYIGGIAGYGNKIYGCYSIAIATDSNNQAGAIAGQVKLTEDSHAISQENVHDNKYVTSNLGGIDGIGYAGIAEEISYAELMQIAGIDSGFSHLTVTFVAEEEEVAKVEYKYGTKLSDITLPNMPEKEGCYGKWQDLTGMVLTGNIIVEAQYYPNITTVKSEETAETEGADGTSISKNLVLIDGVFDASAKLTVTVNAEEFPKELAAGMETVVYHVSLTGAEAVDSAKIRLYNSFGKTVKVYEKIDGKWVEIDSTEYGSYEQVLLTKGEGTFALVVQKKSYLKYIIIAAGVAGVIILLVIIQRIVATVRKKKGK